MKFLGFYFRVFLACNGLRLLKFIDISDVKLKVRCVNKNIEQIVNGKLNPKLENNKLLVNAQQNTAIYLFEIYKSYFNEPYQPTMTGNCCKVDKKSITQLETVIIGESIETIIDSAFRYCLSLKNITISKSVESIGNYVFQSCSGLKTVSIAEGMKTIRDYAFNQCSSLKNITIPQVKYELLSTEGNHKITDSWKIDSLLPQDNSVVEECSQTHKGSKMS